MPLDVCRMDECGKRTQWKPDPNRTDGWVGYFSDSDNRPTRSDLCSYHNQQLRQGSNRIWRVIQGIPEPVKAVVPSCLRSDCTRRAREGANGLCYFCDVDSRKPPKEVRVERYRQKCREYGREYAKRRAARELADALRINAAFNERIGS